MTLKKPTRKQVRFILILSAAAWVFAIVSFTDTGGRTDNRPFNLFGKGYFASSSARR